jgi:hypothetical protein
MSEPLVYDDGSSGPRTLDSCSMHIDNGGRFWLWSEQLGCNLAYKAPTREDCLLSAISSLLFTIELRDERITKLQRIADLAGEFAARIIPEED